MSRWTIEVGDGPVVATAIHAGHGMRSEVAELFALLEEDQLREEDPFTNSWLHIADHQIGVDMSRFEVDLNRPREGAVYRTPDDAWGLELWKRPMPDDVYEASLGLYDAFYTDLAVLLDKVAADHERFVVLDLHSYNHRRNGAEAAVDDPKLNPEINVGTGSLDHSAWSDVVEAFSHSMATVPFDGGHLDVRENVRFQGGHMSKWINARYEGRGCALAIEVKKIYMDEWTGVPNEGLIAEVDAVLFAAASAIRSVLAPTSVVLD